MVRKYEIGLFGLDHMNNEGAEKHEQEIAIEIEREFVENLITKVKIPLSMPDRIQDYMINFLHEELDKLDEEERILNQ